MEIYSHILPYLSQIESIMENDISKEDKNIYGMLGPFIKRGGKRFRPALCLLSCSLVGGSYESALQPAAIIELFHNFTLIHDDIEDESQFRRGEPTLHISHGLPIALNSGDALYTLLWKNIVSLKMPPRRLVELQNLYVESFKRVVDGQGVELVWIRENRFDVSEEEYYTMISGKTSALIGLSCEAGAMIAGCGKRERKSLREYGEKLGAAFQIHDDILNLTGDFEKYKKEIGGDISEGKRTLMVVHCLSKASDEKRKKLISIISSHTKDKKEIDQAIEILKSTGSIEYAREQARKLVVEAKKHLLKFPESKDKSALISLADYSVSRDL